MVDPQGSGANLVGQATDLSLAEELGRQVYLPNRLDRLRRPEALDMQLLGMRFGTLMVGRLTYGTTIRVRTAEMTNLHVNIPIAGHATSVVGRQTVAADLHEAAVFSPGSAPAITWSETCSQLCLMVPPQSVELELEHLLGRRMTKPLQWAFVPSDKAGLTRALEPAIRLLTAELDNPSEIGRVPAIGRHIEALVLSSLLLAHPHNYSDQILRPAGVASRAAISRAAELVREFPGEAWTPTRLAREVHVSVRTLQEGFRSQFGEAPSVYLRRVRLARIRQVLAAATPGTTTVQAVATRYGFLHMGRFAAAYKQAFHESPSHTLNNLPMEN